MAWSQTNRLQLRQESDDWWEQMKCNVLGLKMVTETDAAAAPSWRHAVSVTSKMQIDTWHMFYFTSAQIAMATWDLASGFSFLARATSHVAGWDTHTSLIACLFLPLVNVQPWWTYSCIHKLCFKCLISRCWLTELWGEHKAFENCLQRRCSVLHHHHLCVPQQSDKELLSASIQRVAGWINGRRHPTVHLCTCSNVLCLFRVV